VEFGKIFAEDCGPYVSGWLYGNNRNNKFCVIYFLMVGVSGCCCQEADKLSDEDLYKFLVELKKPSYALKKLKCLPGVSAFSLYLVA